MVAPSGKLALPAVKSDGLTRYQFLDRGAIPDVIVSRDIGAPPKVIESVCRHIREEMSRPELRRKFGLRPCITRLLSGVSGSGKTLAIQAIHHQMYARVPAFTRAIQTWTCASQTCERTRAFTGLTRLGSRNLPTSWSPNDTPENSAVSPRGVSDEMRSRIPSWSDAFIATASSNVHTSLRSSGRSSGPSQSDDQPAA